jgi:hypothetical protein
VKGKAQNFGSMLEKSHEFSFRCFRGGKTPGLDASLAGTWTGSLAGNFIQRDESVGKRRLGKYKSALEAQGKVFDVKAFILLPFLLMKMF